MFDFNNLVNNWILYLQNCHIFIHQVIGNHQVKETKPLPAEALPLEKVEKRSNIQ